MEAVASAAGIAKGTVYLYFPSRAEMLAALRSRYADDLARRARSILESGGRDGADALVATYQWLVADLTRHLLATRRLHHVLFQEAGVSEEETMEPLRGLVRESLRHAMDDGVIEAMDPDTLMRFLLDGFHGVVVPLFHQAGADRRRVLAGLAEIVRRVLVPSTPADADGRLGSRD
jgi:TetR/AcrR family transcriptional regulator, transcriptional repressor for nem operon